MSHSYLKTHDFRYYLFSIETEKPHLNSDLIIGIYCGIHKNYSVETDMVMVGHGWEV